MHMQNKRKRKNLNNINETFFMTEETRLLVVDAIARLESQINNQGEIDKLWKEIKQLFLTEMEKLPDIPTTNSKKMKKNYRKMQPFWNDELGNLWFSACQAEKQYLNFKIMSKADLHHKIF